MPKLDVNKIDAQIHKLQELKRFLSDPTLAPMIEQLVSTNGIGTITTTDRRSLRRGEVITAVENTCRLVPGDFTAREVIAKLDAQGYKFQAKDKMIAVNGALRRLVKRGAIHVTSAGSGKRASTYRVTKRFPREEMQGAA